MDPILTDIPTDILTDMLTEIRSKQGRAAQISEMLQDCIIISFGDSTFGERWGIFATPPPPQSCRFVVQIVERLNHESHCNRHADRNQVEEGARGPDLGDAPGL